MKNQRVKIIQPIPPESEKIAKVILDSAFSVHSALGPGLLESVYEACLAHEIRKNNLSIETQIVIPIKYDSIQLDTGFRIDMLVEKSVIVEIKAVDSWNPVYEAQLLTYLKLTGYRLGFLLNFNVPHLKDGIKRMVL